MRNLFPGYYRPTEEEFSILWRDCIFTFDANVLLNVYRYSQATSERFLEILGRLRERIWLPHQAALEYQENRLGVISDQHKPYEDIPKRLNALFAQIRNDYPRHPFIPIQRVLDHISSDIGEISTILNEAKSGHPDLTENDELREALDNLFAEKVGAEYTPDELKKIYSDAQERFKKQIPPGYEDNKSKKDGDNKYGDVILWYQLKDHAEKLKKPLVLITDDRKADWWQEHKGKTIGPRPELIHEMKSEAHIQFYMYQSDRFMEYAQKHLGIEGDHAVEEVREIRQQDETDIDVRAAHRPQAYSLDVKNEFIIGRVTKDGAIQRIHQLAVATSGTGGRRILVIYLDDQREDFLEEWFDDWYYKLNHNKPTLYDHKIGSTPEEALDWWVRTRGFSWIEQSD
jgi:hypothetical protein